MLSICTTTALVQYVLYHCSSVVSTTRLIVLMEGYCVSLVTLEQVCISHLPMVLIQHYYYDFIARQYSTSYSLNCRVN